MRIFHRGTEEDGSSLLSTLIEITGLLIIISLGVSAFLNITKNGEKLFEKAEKTIEFKNSLCQ